MLNSAGVSVFTLHAPRLRSFVKFKDFFFAGNPLLMEFESFGLGTSSSRCPASTSVSSSSSLSIRLEEAFLTASTSGFSIVVLLSEGSTEATSPSETGDLRDIDPALQVVAESSTMTCFSCMVGWGPFFFEIILLVNFFGSFLRKLFFF